MIRRLALAAAALLFALPALAQDDGRVRPGYWEYAYKVAGIRVSSEFKCVKPSEIDKVFFAGPCNHHHKCVNPVREIGGGKARYEGTWTDKRGRVARIKASGTYTETTFKLSARGRATTGIPLAATMDAKWVSPTCPPGAK
jgi:hypothetical protein